MTYIKIVVVFNYNVLKSQVKLVDVFWELWLFYPEYAEYLPKFIQTCQLEQEFISLYQLVLVIINPKYT